MGVLRKKLARDIVHTKGQAIAVAVVVLCGTAIYVAMYSAYQNLVLTRDAYYAQYRFADFFVMLEQAPVRVRYAIEALPGVREVRCRIVKDVNLDIPDQDGPRTGRIISLPDRETPVVNGIAVMSGRYFDPAGSNEVILSDSFATANQLAVGDTFQASIDNRKHTLRVVGTALCPEYVYTIQGAQDFVPKAESFGILWVPETFAEQAFNMDGACNDITGTVDRVDDLPALLDTIEDLLDPYGVFATIEKKDQVSNNFLSSEIQGLGVNARILPTVFFAVAASVLLVLLNRIVRQERTQIGLLKAYGYSDWSVAMMYVQYALVVSTAGCLAGFVTGQMLANWMINLYADFYKFPVFRSEIYPDVMFRALALNTFFAVAGALGAARRAIRTSPAEAMRPESPRSGHRTFIERSEYLWKRLSFTSKMIIRNVARYKARAVITVIGVCLSSALVFIGQFSSNAMDYMIEFQFSKTQREDIRASLESERGKDAWREFQRLDYVRRAEPLLIYPFEATKGRNRKDIAITGLPADADLLHVLDTEGRVVRVSGEGLLLDERLARDLGAHVGDRVLLRALRGKIEVEREVPIRSVIPQYVGMGAYMEIHALSRLLDEPFAMNAALLKTDTGCARLVANELKDVAAIAAVTVKADAYQSLMDTLATSMWVSNAIIAFFASVIACAIIYNSTLVSLMERRRELATLHVLGFTLQEVGRIMYRENVLLSILGLLLGMPFGVVLCRLMVEAYETDLFRFPWHLEPRAFFTTAILTMVFVGVANLALHRKVRRLEMVETLKAQE